MNDCPEHPRRRDWLRAGFTLGAGGLLLPRLAAAQSVARGSNVAQLQGEVWINDQRLRPGASVTTGDVIRTGPDGRAVFSVGDSAFQVRPRSVLVVERGARLFVVGGLRLLTGAVVAVFGKGPARFVSTPTATAGIRGTGVYVEVVEDHSYFCTCYGKVDLHAGVAHELVESTHHAARTLGVDMGRGGQIKESPNVNHTDAELDNLERLVGRRAPWMG